MFIYLGRFDQEKSNGHCRIFFQKWKQSGKYMPSIVQMLTVVLLMVTINQKYILIINKNLR